MKSINLRVREVSVEWEAMGDLAVRRKFGAKTINREQLIGVVLGEDLSYCSDSPYVFVGFVWAVVVQ